MAGLNKDRFDVSQMNHTGTHYLVVGVSAAEKIQNYQVEILAHNPNLKFLNLNVSNKDDKVYFYYNVSGRVPLPQLLMGNKISSETIISILIDVLKVLVMCHDYLLSGKCILLDQEYIYINPENHEISLVYLPVPFEGDSIRNFKSFTLELSNWLSKNQSYKGESFLEDLIGIARSDSNSFREFDNTLRQLRENVKNKKEISGSTSKALFDSNDFIKEKENKVSKEKIDPWNDVEIQKVMPQVELEPINEDSLRNQNMYNDGRNKNPNEDYYAGAPKYKPLMTGRHYSVDELDDVYKQPAKKNKRDKKQRPSPAASDRQYGMDEFYSASAKPVAQESSSGYLFGALVLQVILIATVLAVIYSGIITLGNPEDRRVTYTFLIASAVVVSAIIWEKVVEKKLSQNRKRRDALDIAENMMYEGQKQPEPNYSSNQAQSSAPAYIAPPSHSASTDAAAWNISNEETIILFEDDHQFPYLEAKIDGVTKKFPINKSTVLFGRLQGQADYCITNTAIGRVHAQIASRRGTFVIRDMASKNGTFINGMRIDENRDYPIRDGDKIGFADVELEFFIP